MAQRETGEDDLGPYKVKDPAANVDVEFDWGPWMTAEGETEITSSTWSAPAPLVVTVPGIEDTYTFAKVAGGNRGFDYFVYNTVVIGTKTEVSMVRIKVR